MKRWLVGVAVVSALAGCAGPGLAAGSGSPSTGGPSPVQVNALDRQAREALSAYEKAWQSTAGRDRLVSVGPLTQELGVWTAQQGAMKAAVTTGEFVAATALPTTTPPPARVRWANGSSFRVTPLSAAEAFHAMTAEPAARCPGCPPVTLGAPKLGTTTLATTRGPATVPAWLFPVQGAQVTVARVAVSNANQVAPPVPQGYRQGIQLSAASGSASGRTLTVQFLGAPLPATQECGADYTAKAVESTHAVVVIVYEHPRMGTGACVSSGKTRTAPVTLTSALGDRAVLDVRTGQAVPITRR